MADQPASGAAVEAVNKADRLTSASLPAVDSQQAQRQLAPYRDTLDRVLPSLSRERRILEPIVPKLMDKVLAGLVEPAQDGGLNERQLRDFDRILTGIRDGIGVALDTSGEVDEVVLTRRIGELFRKGGFAALENYTASLQPEVLGADANSAQLLGEKPLIAASEERFQSLLLHNVGFGDQGFAPERVKQATSQPVGPPPSPNGENRVTSFPEQSEYYRQQFWQLAPQDSLAGRVLAGGTIFPRLMNRVELGLSGVPGGLSPEQLAGFRDTLTNIINCINVAHNQSLLTEEEIKNRVERVFGAGGFAGLEAYCLSPQEGFQGATAQVISLLGEKPLLVAPEEQFESFVQHGVGFGSQGFSRDRVESAIGLAPK